MRIDPVNSESFKINDQAFLDSLLVMALMR
jgi:hypothetical protein